MDRVGYDGPLIAPVRERDLRDAEGAAVFVGRDGGILLAYRDRYRDSLVEVWLTRKDDYGEDAGIASGEEVLLGRSDSVPKGEKLDHINGVYIVLGLEKGFYKGRLHISYPDGTEPKDRGVHIHVKKKEYNQEDSD